MIFSKKTIFSTLILALIFAIAPLQNVVAASAREISREEYINLYKHIAIAHQRRYGIPASITMAQGILESGNGNSTLARKSNNHFGIKCKGDWTGRKVRHDDDAPNECFRAYSNVEKSYEDHAEFLDSSPRYDSLFNFSPTDYRSWARGLKNAGYATAPDYTQRLIKIIEDNKLYLLDGKNGDADYIAETTKLPRKSAEKRASEDEAKIDPNNFRITINTVNGYNIYSTNKSTYVTAKEGDKYRTLGRKFDISASALRKYNDIAGRRSKLDAGEIVYLERKKKRWLGNTRQHTVRRGESLYSLSQSYGIRLSSLRKRNKLSKGEEPSVGATIKLR